jgi:hypothetical protein
VATLELACDERSVFAVRAKQKNKIVDESSMLARVDRKQKNIQVANYCIVDCLPP